MSRHPPVRWAQRSDKLYVAIDLPDAENVKLKLDPAGKFFFSATSGADQIPYEIELDLYDKVDVNESKASVGSRNICYLVKKAKSKWWSRLLKQEGKPPVFLKVDWDKWIDEDEGGAAGNDPDFGGFDLSKLGIGGGDDLDDDDDAGPADEAAAADNDDSGDDHDVTRGEKGVELCAANGA